MVDRPPPLSPLKTAPMSPCPNQALLDRCWGRSMTRALFRQVKQRGLLPALRLMRTRGLSSREALAAAPPRM